MIPSASPHGNTQQEEITTIFVVGFPQNIQEREFQNMFIFSPGFEAATLKVPVKDEVDAGGHRKQIIGFAKFRTRLQALEARDILSGRKVDAEKGCVLKAEMAKKNLHTKRGLSNEHFHPAFQQYGLLNMQMMPSGVLCNGVTSAYPGMAQLATRPIDSQDPEYMRLRNNDSGHEDQYLLQSTYGTQPLGPNPYSIYGLPPAKTFVRGLESSTSTLSAETPLTQPRPVSATYSAITSVSEEPRVDSKRSTPQYSGAASEEYVTYNGGAGGLVGAQNTVQTPRSESVGSGSNPGSLYGQHTPLSQLSHHAGWSSIVRNGSPKSWGDGSTSKTFTSASPLPKRFASPIHSMNNATLNREGSPRSNSNAFHNSQQQSTQPAYEPLHNPNVVSPTSTNSIYGAQKNLKLSLSSSNLTNNVNGNTPSRLSAVVGATESNNMNKIPRTPLSLSINTSLANRWSKPGLATAIGAQNGATSISPAITQVSGSPGVIGPHAHSHIGPLALPVTPMTNFEPASYPNAPCAALHLKVLPVSLPLDQASEAVRSLDGFRRVLMAPGSTVGGSVDTGLYLEFHTEEHAIRAREWLTRTYSMADRDISFVALGNGSQAPNDHLQPTNVLDGLANAIQMMRSATL